MGAAGEDAAPLAVEFSAEPDTKGAVGGGPAENSCGGFGGVVVGEVEPVRGGGVVVVDTAAVCGTGGSVVTVADSAASTPKGVSDRLVP